MSRSTPTTGADPVSPARPDWLTVGPVTAIDHTLLKPDVTAADIDRLCEEAVEYGFAAVCLPPRFVARARERLYGSDVGLATVIGFPLGYETTDVKCYQAEQAITAGATELDMVIQLGAAASGDFQTVEADIAAVVKAAGEVPVKVIIECCLFDAAIKRRLTEAVVTAGAAYVKTSTGFAASGAMVEDVRLLQQVASGSARVKAAGGIRDWPTCLAMLEAGASRIGTSSGVAIAGQWLRARR